MSRALWLTACVLMVLLLGSSGCKSKKEEKDTTPEEATLELELPEGKEPPEWAPERVSKLQIDGVDFSTPRDTKRYIKVDPKKGQDSVKVVYSFWPRTYINVVRTKIVKMEKGKRVTASLMKADRETPDQIFPIFVPTPHKVVEEMCRMAGVKAGDVVYDIGCGDGRLVITAVKDFNADRGVGLDIDKELVEKCKKNAANAKVGEKTEFRCEDALKIKDYGEATVVLLYVGDEFGAVIGPVLKKSLKPGARIVSHRFSLGDWQEDKKMSITAKNDRGKDEDFDLLLWTVKAEK